MALIFDGPTKVITLTTGTTSLGVRDLWSRWVDWFLTSDNSKYLPAFQQVGGNDIDISAGTSIPIYAFLMNGWKLKPQEANHTLSVTDGILLVNGGGDPFNNTVGAYTVRINYSQPVQAITVATGGGSGGLTTEQDIKLTRINTMVDSPVSEIAVGWNPYITGVNGLKKGIQKIVDKVEEKGEEVKTKIETEVKSIVIPEQKDPIVNVTTEKIDTTGFIDEIKKIKPEVNITTEKVHVDMSSVLTAIKNIPQPVIPEPKEVDMLPIIQSIEKVIELVDEQNEKIDKIEDYVEDEMKEKEKETDEKNKEMHEIEEENNLKRPFPSSFTATLN